MSVHNLRDDNQPLTDNERALLHQINMLAFSSAKEIGRLESCLDRLDERLDKLTMRIVELERLLRNGK